jgi:predicted transcriptional regulator of viral defense system
VSLLETEIILERIGPVVETREAAAALLRSVPSTSRTLGALAEAGHAHRIRHGLWSIGPTPPDPYWVVGDLTRPHPSYVSFQSALNFHGMIDQIPRDTTVASLDRARRITTTIGTYAVHHIPGELLGGWAKGPRGRVATPEKAIFDLAYISAARGAQPRRVPEIDLPAGFDRAAIDEWIAKIGDPRIATLTKRGVRQILARAIR